MKSNSEINRIIKFIINIINSENNLSKHLVFSSKSICKNKILILSKVKQRNIYHYVNEAIDNNIKAIVTCNKIDLKKISKEIPILYTKILESNINLLLSHIYSNPLKDKHIIGVTGTDGKTSTVNYLAQSLSNNIINKKVGIISSYGNGIYPKLFKNAYTTPPPNILFKYFEKFNKENVDIIIIECSSHGLDQGRVNNINFDSSIFTNITSDHMDYHKTMKNYIDSKLKLIKQTTKNTFINSDCKNLNKIKKKKNINIIKYKYIDKNRKKLKEKLFPKDLITKYLNKNFDVSTISIKKILNALKPLKGRNTFISKSNKKIIIDSAHTPAALESILKNIRSTDQFKNDSLKLILVFGCGGDRDKYKRKKMGEIANKYSDFIYLTNDNPRSENPMKIINQISKGIINKNILTIFPNRRLAIKRAISSATKKHLVLISGKGDEDFIEESSNKIPHNDIKYVRMLLR